MKTAVNSSIFLTLLQKQLGSISVDHSVLDFVVVVVQFNHYSKL